MSDFYDVATSLLLVIPVAFSFSSLVPIFALVKSSIVKKRRYSSLFKFLSVTRIAQN